MASRAGYRPEDQPVRLALFDLDHTLIPFDSGLAWTRYLVRAGALDAQAEQRYLGFCHQYVAGTLDIYAMHRASMAPLQAFTAAQLHAWRDDFARQIDAELPASTRALVAQHQARGDVCAIVTATSRWVAEPFARAFRVEHLLATEADTVAGRPGEEIRGLACYREHKRTHVDAWLQQQVLPTLERFEASWFYSDSVSDLPLLEAVTHPVAVHPDEQLRTHAEARGWRIAEPA